MKKTLSAIFLGAALTVPALSSAGSAGELEDIYFSGENPTLTQQEREALSIAQRWQAGSASGIRPFEGRNGAIQFVYGAQNPSIVCAVLQVCDIALQPGEVVTPGGLKIGDKARWTAEPAISGSGAKEVLHIMVSPLDVGLETNMVVTTNRRTYHMRLRSHRTQYMPQVSFVYPEDALAKWEFARIREEQEREASTIPQTGEYLGNLSFDYSLSGSAPWKPLRVYNDGVKTFIQMPRSMQNTEAPTLLVVRKDGGLFSDAETVMVNYRVQGDRYIVDSVFDKAILIAGVGRSQDRVTISRR